jgi:hypothetical protein
MEDKETSKDVEQEPVTTTEVKQDSEKSKVFDISAKDRMILMNVLPKETTYVTMRLLVNLKEKLELNEKEYEEYKIVRYPNGSIQFQDLKLAETIKAVRIDNLVIGIIKEEFQKLDKEQKITSELVELYELFIN